MIRNRDTITIMLTPDHLSMASVRSGKVVQAERVFLDSSKWEECWKGGLHLLDQPLRQLLARFGGASKGCRAELFYTSPGSVCRTDISDADEATSIAKMEGGLKQSVGRANPADAAPLFTSDDSTLTIGIADEEANLQRLYAWLNRSKVVVDQMIPSQASIVQQAVLSSLSMEPDVAILYISERSNVIGYCENGVPKLVRLIEIGYDKLAGVYERAMKGVEDEASDEAQDSSCFESRGAGKNDGAVCDWLNMLFSEGVPVSAGKGGEKHSYSGIMPAMAPVLQRISIEIKQTFRFASSLKSAPSKLIICGPGAAIPNIGIALSQNLDMHVDVIDDIKGYQICELFGEGTSEHAAACKFDLDIELLPRAAKEIRARKGLDRMLKYGAAAVVAMIGGQYLYATHQSVKIEQVMSDQSSMIDRIERDRDRRASIGVMAESIGSAATLIDEAMGDRVEWVGFLSTMPNEDFPLIQISELQGRMNAQHPIVSLSGIALGESDGSDASQVLSQYIKALRGMPQVKRIEIGSTSRSMVDESTWGLEFVLAIEIVSTNGPFSQYMALGQAGQGVAP